MMSDLTDSEKLKQGGLRATVARLAIYRIFLDHPSMHFTAEEVFRQLGATGEDIGIATVYRALTQFEQANLIQRHHFESDKAVYELNQGEHHDHLVCLDCGAIEEFCDDEIESRQQIVAKQKGFILHGHALNLFVKCTRYDCVNRQNNHDSSNKTIRR